MLLVQICCNVLIFLRNQFFFPSLLTSQTPVAYGEYVFMLNAHMLRILHREV
jgi:hypothetical protein